MAIERQQEFELLQHKMGGHLSGGIYKHKSTGEKVLIKIPNTESEAKNEILAAKLYELAGVKIPMLELALFNGKTAIISKWLDGYSNLDENQIPINVAGLYENFVVDAWLANWDVAGLDNDNIGFIGNEAVRIDLGGSLLYRGMGELKGKMFSKKVSETCSLLNFDRNYNAASVFKDTKVKHFLDGVKKIDSLDFSAMKNLVIEHAPGDDYEQKMDLFSNLFYNRKDDLIAKAAQLANSNPESYLKVELCGMEYDHHDEL